LQGAPTGTLVKRGNSPNLKALLHVSVQPIRVTSSPRPSQTCPEDSVVGLIRVFRDQRLFDNYPGLFAVFHARHRLLTPRHPPCALSSLTTIIQCSSAVPKPRPSVAVLNSASSTNFSCSYTAATSHSLTAEEVSLADFGVPQVIHGNRPRASLELAFSKSSASCHY